jgi:ABC-type glycerol-3-phosphate transport system substrate-binding protein
MFYDLGVLFYRKDLIGELPNADVWKKKLNAGITWQDIFELKKRHFSSKPVYVFQAKAYEGLICNYQEIGAGLGTPAFRKDDFLLNEKNISSINTFIYDLINKKQIVPREVTQFDEASSFLYALENDIPLMRAWVTNINNIYFPQEFKEKVNNLEIAPLPRKKGRQFSTALGGWNLIISRYSRHKKEAALFLKFVISPKVQAELFNRGFYLPVLKEFQFEKNTKNAYMIKPLMQKWIKSSIRRPSNINYTRLSDIYSGLLNRALSGQISAGKVYQLARERIE